MTVPLAEMRTDLVALIEDWGTSCVIGRNAGTTNTQGRRSSDWTTLATEKFWLQAVNITDQTMQAQGVVEGSTHVAFQAFAGTPLQETDRLTAAGDAFAYDVTGVQVLPNHRRNFLKQVKK